MQFWQQLLTGHQLKYINRSTWIITKKTALSSNISYLCLNFSLQLLGGSKQQGGVTLQESRRCIKEVTLSISSQSKTRVRGGRVRRNIPGKGNMTQNAEGKRVHRRLEISCNWLVSAWESAQRVEAGCGTIYPWGQRKLLKGFSKC